MHSSFETFIIEQARAGKLPGIFRRLEPNEGSIHCINHAGGGGKTPDHCLRVINPGDLVAGYTVAEKYPQWTDEQRRGEGGADGSPDCLHCEVKLIAKGLIEDLSEGKPDGHQPRNDVELILAGYVDAAGLDKEVYASRATNPYVMGEWIEVFFFIWQTEAADLDLAYFTGDEDVDVDVATVEGVIGDWMMARRKRGSDLAEEALIESRKSGYGRSCDRSNAALLIHLIEMTEAEVPAKAMRFLEGFANTPEYRMKCLIWQKGWMEHMAKPGPKLTLHKGGVEKAMPYPEKSQKQAVANLARIEQEIEKLQAELSQ
jgi:hypothetical protein